MMTPAELSWQLRHSSAPYMQQRRAIAGLSLAAISAMSVIALHQLGLLARLPDLPFAGCDSNSVTESDVAYSRLATPDGVLGLGNFAVTLGLAAMGGANRAVKNSPGFRWRSRPRACSILVWLPIWSSRSAQRCTRCVAGACWRRVLPSPALRWRCQKRGPLGGNCGEYK